jgi:hypothetical protein
VRGAAIGVLERLIPVRADLARAVAGTPEHDQQVVGARSRAAGCRARVLEDRHVVGAQHPPQEHRGLLDEHRDRHALDGALPELADRALRVARGHEPALVAAPVGRVEEARADDQRAAVGVALDRRAEQGGQARAVGAQEVERHLAHLAAQLEQRAPVRRVVDPRAGRQEIEQGAADDGFGIHPDRPQQRPVGLRDRAVGQQREVAARRVLVELLE